MHKSLIVKCSAFCLLFSACFGDSLYAQQATMQIKLGVPANTLSGSGFFLAGSMNGWNPADSAWLFKKEGPDLVLNISLKKGMHEFKVTRGSWNSVECGTNGQAISNRIVVLNKDTTVNIQVLAWQDNFKQAEQKHTLSKHVRIIHTAFDIPQLNRKRRVWIYLPESYSKTTKKYPVMYMQDGQNVFDAYTSGYGEWGTDEILDSLSERGRRQSILVAVDHGNEYRLTEYNPFDNARFGKGSGSGYADFMANTLKPYIDAKFRTKPGRRHTSIAGSSMGGLISLYILSKYPDVFGSAGVFSPAFWTSEPIYDYVAQSKLDKHNRIYFVSGALESDEMVPDMKKMHDLLLKKGIPAGNMIFKVAPDGKHKEWFWHREYPAFYEWTVK